MSRRTPLRALLTAAALLLVFAAQANAQATRTWVSGVGDDVNPCSRTAPCKTFAGTISKTAAGGEINALDPGAFGTVTITKAITIDVRGFEGGVLNTGTFGIVINAQATDDVVLRGLDIFGGSGLGGGCGYSGTSGVKVMKARSVRIEDSRIARQQKAIELVPGAPVNVFVNRVDIGDNCTHGIQAVPAAGGTANVTVQDSTISNSGTALSVADNATAWLTRSTLFANALGFETLGTGVTNDFGDNRLIANATDGQATNDLSPVAPTGPTGHAGPAGPAGQTGAQGPAGVAGTPALELLLAASNTKLTARAGKAVALRYASTAAARTTLTVSRAGKPVATVRGTAAKGANSFVWNGRIGKTRAPAGTYRLTVAAAGFDGQTDETTVSLTLRRR
jgi:parallel beta helix pectate lyase-like protein